MGCCGGQNKCTLQRRATIAGIVDIVLAIIGLTVGYFDVRRLNDIRDDKTKPDEERDEATRTLYLVSVVIVINGVKLLMGYILWRGATQRISKYCKLWLRVSIALWLIHLIDFIIKLSLESAGPVYSIVLTSLQIVGRIGAMVIVQLFINQLAKEKKGMKSEVV